MIDYVQPDLFIDHHNAGSTTAKDLMYSDGLDIFATQVAAFTIRQMTMYLKTKKFLGVLPDADSEPLILGYSAKHESVGCPRNYYVYDKGITSITFETSKSFNYSNGEYVEGKLSDWYNTDACSAAVVCFTNFVINLINAVTEYKLPIQHFPPISLTK